jgi:hypothetical protein
MAGGVLRGLSSMIDSADCGTARYPDLKEIENIRRRGSCTDYTL